MLSISSMFTISFLRQLLDYHEPPCYRSSLLHKTCGYGFTGLESPHDFFSIFFRLCFFPGEKNVCPKTTRKKPVPQAFPTSPLAPRSLPCSATVEKPWPRWHMQLSRSFLVVSAASQLAGWAPRYRKGLGSTPMALSRHVHGHEWKGVPQPQVLRIDMLLPTYKSWDDPPRMSPFLQESRPY